MAVFTGKMYNGMLSLLSFIIIIVVCCYSASERAKLIIIHVLGLV